MKQRLFVLETQTKISGIQKKMKENLLPIFKKKKATKLLNNSKMKFRFKDTKMHLKL